MENFPVRILLVEDFEPFRNLIRILLEGKPHLQIIAEVADGQEAVRQAAELKPTLILLDIGLPSLNGLDVARQVRELSLDSKIIFVSQESSPEFVQEALSLGASGFVTKTRVANDLVPAIQAVLSGGTFVSRTSDQSTPP
ncbi:MAG: response regulator transcription factor [Candidatus Sulfotelmatobacter sp.]|jgi:DNA-binding NarL/FixJ family response regulator